MKPFRLLLGAFAALALIAGAAEQHLAHQSHTVSKVSTPHKVVALTIDDGPHHKVTPEILTILKEKQVKATFFVLGVSAEHSPRLLAQEVADGHEIGTHTYSHPILPRLDAKRIAEEFDKAEKVIITAAPPPTLFRPPGGAYNPQVLEAARQKGYTVVLWSIDPRDWSRPPADKVVETVLRNVRPGSIILLHDGQHPLPTPQALGRIIDGLREQGYAFVTVSELLQYNEVRHSFSFLDHILQ